MWFHKSNVKLFSVLVVVHLSLTGANFGQDASPGIEDMIAWLPPNVEVVLAANPNRSTNLTKSAPVRTHWNASFIFAPELSIPEMRNNEVGFFIERAVEGNPNWLGRN
jgi:hypothetical protein